MRVGETDPLMGKLVGFLNFDFKTGTQDRLKEAGLNVHELERAGWRKRGPRLQEEIRSDLIPLLTRTPTDDMIEREEKLKLRQQWQVKKTRDKKQREMMLSLMYAGPRLYHGPRFYLDRLLEKVNHLELRFHWYAEPGQHELTVYEPDLTKPLSKKTGYPEPVAGTERNKANPARGLLGSERKKTTIVGEKFIVARQLSYAKFLRDEFYGIIAESLENGSFSRLRICPECEKFFLALDPKRRFCENSKCKDNFHNKERLQSGYFKENRRKRERLNRLRKNVRE